MPEPKIRTPYTANRSPMKNQIEMKCLCSDIRFPILAHDGILYTKTGCAGVLAFPRRLQPAAEAHYRRSAAGPIPPVLAECPRRRRIRRARERRRCPLERPTQRARLQRPVENRGCDD